MFRNLGDRKPHTSQAIKTAKSLFDPMKSKSPNVALQDELLYVTWTSQLRTGQPSIFTIQVWRTACCITCTTKLINTAARLVWAHLHWFLICTYQKFQNARYVQLPNSRLKSKTWRQTLRLYTTMEALPWYPVIAIDNFWKLVAFAIP